MTQSLRLLAATPADLPAAHALAAALGGQASALAPEARSKAGDLILWPDPASHLAQALESGQDPVSAAAMWQTLATRLLALATKSKPPQLLCSANLAASAPATGPLPAFPLLPEPPVTAMTALARLLAAFWPDLVALHDRLAATSLLPPPATPAAPDSSALADLARISRERDLLRDQLHALAGLPSAPPPAPPADPTELNLLRSTLSDLAPLIGTPSAPAATPELDLLRATLTELAPLIGSPAPALSGAELDLLRAQLSDLDRLLAARPAPSSHADEELGLLRDQLAALLHDLPATAPAAAPPTMPARIAETVSRLLSDLDREMTRRTEAELQAQTLQSTLRSLGLEAPMS